MHAFFDINRIFFSCCSILLNHGAPIDCVNPKKQTPLHIASKSVALSNIVELVERGADVNCIDNRLRTPLFKAENPDAVKLLLRYGADIRKTAYIPSTLGKFSLHKYQEERVTAIEYHLMKSRSGCAKVILDSALKWQTDDTLILDLGVFAMNQSCPKYKMPLFHAVIGTNNETLLLHPLMQIFVYLQFQSFYASYALKCIFPLLFIITMSYAGTKFVDIAQAINCRDRNEDLFSYPFHCEGNILKSNQTNITLNDALQDFIIDNWIKDWLFVWTAVLIVIYALLEIVDLLNFGIREYSKKFINIIEVLLIIFSCSFIITSSFANYDNYLEYALHCAGWMVFLAWIDFAYYIGKFSFGQYVFMVTDVANNLLNYIVPFMGFLLAFSFGFHALLNSNQKFSGLYGSYLEVLIMLIGNVEHENFYIESSSAMAISVQLMFHLFLFLAVYILNNLMIAVTVSKTNFKELSDRTKIMQAKLAIEHIEWQRQFKCLKCFNGKLILKTCKEEESYKVCIGVDQQESKQTCLTLGA